MKAFQMIETIVFEISMNIAFIHFHQGFQLTVIRARILDACVVLNCGYDGFCAHDCYSCHPFAYFLLPYYIYFKIKRDMNIIVYIDVLY